MVHNLEEHLHGRCGCGEMGLCHYGTRKKSQRNKSNLVWLIATSLMHIVVFIAGFTRFLFFWLFSRLKRKIRFTLSVSEIFSGPSGLWVGRDVKWPHY